jgi:hypothetical protein
MSAFKEKITLVNAQDIGNAREALIPESNIRKVTMDAGHQRGYPPKTGAFTIEGSIASILADGSMSNYNQTEAVKIQWKNRSAIQQALVVPEAEDILLSALCLEAMDLMVDRYMNGWPASTATIPCISSNNNIANL